MGTLQDFVSRYGITMTYRETDRNPLWVNIPANHYRVTLRCGGRRYTTTFSMGIGIERKPTAEDVIEALASDSASIESSLDFEWWRDEAGYDDTRHSKLIYQACIRESLNLGRLLGKDAYQELLWSTDRR